MDDLNETLSFFNINNETSAYWLGFISADGCITRSKAGGKEHLVVTLAEVDSGHLHKLAKLLGVAVNGPYLTKKNGKLVGTRHFTMRCNNQDIVEGLKSNGVVPRKSLILKPWSGPDELMRHYWRGLVDGDGWISLSKSQVGAEVGLVGSKDIVFGFSEHMIKVSGLSKFSVFTNKTAWRCQVTGLKKPKIIVEHLYKDATVFLERKKEKADKLLLMEGTWVDLSNVTADRLESLYDSLGTWEKVARELKTNRGSIRRLRMRLQSFVAPKTSGNLNP